jgi:hypothetical protein
VIDFGQPALHHVDAQGGLTLFRDHAEPRQVWYLPDRPRVRHQPDGRLELALTRYQVDDALRGILGAGLLSLTVDLAVDEARLEPLRARLGRRLGLDLPVRLSPVQPEAGSCRLLLLDRASDDVAPAGEGGAGESAADPGAEASPLVERILGATTPALFGSQPATFLAVLSETGTRVVEEALRQGELPVGLVYALDVVGIRPALRGRFTARWRQVYEFMERRFHGGKLLLAVDIGPIMEELEQAELVRVEVDQLVPEAERVASYRDILQQVQEEIVRKFFAPTLGTKPLEEGGDEFTEMLRRGISEFVGAFAFTFSMRDVDRTELKTTTHELAVDAAEVRVMAPQGMLASLVDAAGEFDADAHIRSLQPGPSPELRFDIAAGVDLAQHGVTALELTARYGGRTEVMTLTPEAPGAELVVFHRDGLGRAIELSWVAHFNPGEDGEGLVRAEAEPRAWESRVIRLDPRELVREVEVRALAQGVPFGAWPRVLVDLRVLDTSRPEPHEATLTLHAEQAEAMWRVRAAREAALTLQRRVRWVAANGRVVTRDWEVVEPGILVVGAPFPDALRVTLVGSARFGVAVDRLVVELARAETPDDVTPVVLSAETPNAEWAVALPPLDDPADPDADRERRAWRYRTSLRTPSGEVRTGEWQEGEGARLVVGEGFQSLREAKLMIVGPPPERLGILALKVRFAFEDPESGLSAEHEQMVEALGTPIAWRYPVADPARRAWTWQLTRILADGTLVRDPPEPQRTEELMVVHVLR